MPAAYVEARHEDGRFYRARVLHRYRTPDGWRYVVTYSTGVGMTYLRGVWADELRSAAAEDPQEANELSHHGEGQDVAWILRGPRR